MLHLAHNILKMEPQPLEKAECKAEEPQVEVVTSTASLKEGSPIMTCSQASIKSEASETSLKSNTDTSPKVCTTVVKCKNTSL